MFTREAETYGRFSETPEVSATPLITVLPVSGGLLPNCLLSRWQVFLLYVTSDVNAAKAGFLYKFHQSNEHHLQHNTKDPFGSNSNDQPTSVTGHSDREANLPELSQGFCLKIPPGFSGNPSAGS